jgi:hypothetical protein
LDGWPVACIVAGLLLEAFSTEELADVEHLGLVDSRVQVAAVWCLSEYLASVRHDRHGLRKLLLLALTGRPVR